MTPTAASRMTMPLAVAAAHYRQGRSLDWIVPLAGVSTRTLAGMLRGAGVAIRAVGTRMKNQGRSA